MSPKYHRTTYTEAMNRTQLLTFGTAAAAFSPLLLSSLAEAAVSADPADIASLNAAIELERAGIKAYNDAAATKLLSPAVLAIAAGFIADHTAHLDALSGAVKAAGATPSTGIAPIAYPTLASEHDIIVFANVVERKAASTYLSVIPDLKNRQLAGVAAAILGVETTHVALLSNVLGVKPYPSGFVV
jgi:rubrerythrin